MIFPFIENKLNILRFKKNSNYTIALRWVIIQDCAILVNKEEREYVIFNIFLTFLNLNYSKIVAIE